MSSHGASESASSCHQSSRGSSPTKQRVPKPDYGAVVQMVQEAGYDDFGFVLVRSEYTNEDAWTRWNTTFY